MNKTYQETASSFPFSLPDGVNFPENVAQGNPDAKNELYESGVGGMQAYFFYQCAQEKVVLDYRTSDPARAAKALEMIVEMSEAPFWQAHVDDSAGVWADTLAKARLGDYAELLDSYESDCGDDWTQGRVK